MGSPSARLKVRESLRPWIESGLEFVYAPGGLAVEAQPQPPAPSQSAQSAASPQQVQRPTVRPEPPQIAPTPRPAAPTQPTPAVNAGGPFPEPWQSFLRFAKAEARIVWTYMELGLDLAGQSDPRRRSVLKNVQAHLKWPAGTINFWPVAALTHGALQPDNRMFWRGWELWRTPHIVCFGDEALSVVLPDADPKLDTHLLEQVIVHKLPPLAKLMTLLPHEQQMTVDSLAGLRL